MRYVSQEVTAIPQEVLIPQVFPNGSSCPSSVSFSQSAIFLSSHGEVVGVPEISVKGVWDCICSSPIKHRSALFWRVQVKAESGSQIWLQHSLHIVILWKWPHTKWHVIARLSPWQKLTSPRLNHELHKKGIELHDNAKSQSSIWMTWNIDSKSLHARGCMHIKENDYESSPQPPALKDP
jgi:hypothetical protein